MRCAAVLMVLALARVAAAAPHGTRLTYFGDPARSIAVSWNSSDPADDQLLYGTSAGALATMVRAQRTAQASPLDHSFTARVTGLAPGTTYYYRVGGAGGALRPAPPAAPLQWRTLEADPCRRFRFVLIGDNRADLDGIGANPVWREILGEAMAQGPDFFLNTGDMVKNGERADEWAPFIDVSESGWALVPSLLTMGNHDEDQQFGDSALYNQLYELPRNSATGSEDYYGIDVGPLHIVSLNSQFSNPAASEMTQMVAWLDADLGATQQPWKIVFFHKSIYSRGNHSTGEENGAALNRLLVPIFDRHQVDFVLSGHSHDYERYAPSVGVDSAFGGSGRNFPAGDGAAFRARATVPDGATATTYMVSGGAGALTTEFMGLSCIDPVCTRCTGFNFNCNAAVYNKDVAGTVVYDGRHNFGVFTVDGDRISVEVWTTAAGNSGGAQRSDSFMMTSGTTCATPPPSDAGVDASASGADASGALDAAGTSGADGGQPVGAA